LCNARPVDSSAADPLPRSWLLRAAVTVLEMRTLYVPFAGDEEFGDKATVPTLHAILTSILTTYYYCMVAYVRAYRSTRAFLRRTHCTHGVPSHDWLPCMTGVLRSHVSLARACREGVRFVHLPHRQDVGGAQAGAREDASTGIYVCRSGSCQEIVRDNTPRQVYWVHSICLTALKVDFMFQGIVVVTAFTFWDFKVRCPRGSAAPFHHSVADINPGDLSGCQSLAVVWR
jgi:hypothetical protein